MKEQENNSEEDKLVSIIKITKTPDGPAPLSVRKVWKDVFLLAVNKPKSTPEIDPVNMDVVIRKGSYMVPMDLAFKMLRNQKPQESSEIAINWFKENFPEEIEYLSFGINEFEIIGNIDLSKLLG